MSPPAGSPPQAAESLDSADGTARSVLLVLGMHRSGTSALTGVLQALGVELGEELLAPTLDNPKGYFENAEVVETQEALLAALGRRWQDPRPLPADWRQRPVSDDAHVALTALVEVMLRQSPVAAVKDPRISRLVPLWRDVARGAGAALGAALVVRHPDEVAGSLHKRDGLTRARSHLLWMTYLLEAERDSRGLPRAFVSYEGLLADWRDTLMRMRLSGLDAMVPMPDADAEAQIDTFLDASLRRQGKTDLAVESPFESLAVELYGLVLRCAMGQVVDVPAAFDDVARRLTPLATRYLEAPLELEQVLERQRNEQASLDASLQLAAIRALWRPVLPLRPPGAARLYYRVETGMFSEVDAVSVEPLASGVQREVVFRLRGDTRIDHLRVDPDVAQGVYAIESLAIDGNEVDDLAGRLLGVHEFPMPIMRPGDVARFAAVGDDPHFVVDVRGLVPVSDAADVLEIKVAFRFETVLSEVVGAVGDLQQIILARGAEIVHQQAVLQTAVRQIDEQQQRIEAGLAVVPHAVAHQQQLTLMLESELSALREQQAQMLAWTRRRSPGYWWRRLLGRNS